MKYSTIKYGLNLLLVLLTQVMWAGHEKGIESFKGNDIFAAAQSSTYDITTGDITNKDQAMYLDIMDHSYRPVRYYPNWNTKLNLSKITNDVVLRFDDNQRQNFIGDWVLKIEYTLYFNADQNFDHYETGTLEITYNESSGYIDQQRKVYATFGALLAHQGLNPRLYIRETTITAAPADEALLQTGNIDLFVDLELHSEKCYILQGDDLLVNVTNEHLYTFTNTTDYDYAQINWAYVEGAESYELEWLFVDLGVPTDPTINIGTGLTDYPNFNYDFDNAFGVTLQENTFKIPLNFPTGILLYRVRAVGYNGDCTSITYGEWSSPLTKGLIHNLNPADYLVINGFESDKTWQSSSTFIEGGKHADAITYFDGSLRGRQSIAVNKEANIGVVNTPVYDYSGRATLNLAPFAVEANSLKYKSNVTQYPKASFDATTTIGNPLPYTSTSNEISASNYYSSNNSFNHSHKHYIPRSEDKPFSRTLIKNDGTNRIKEQSGMGPNFQIGSGKTTKYYYQKPSQYELDVLFGNDVGYAENYSKEIIVDPNGQGTYTIKNKNGQVIVSGLYGEAPPNLNALPNALSAQIENVELDISNQNFQNLKSTDLNHHFDVVSTTSFSDLYYNYKLSLGNPQITFVSNNYPSGGNFNVNRQFDLSLMIKDQNGSSISSPLNQTGINSANIDYPSTGNISSGSYTYFKKLSLSNSLASVISDFESNQNIIHQTDFQTNYQPCGCNEDCIGQQMNAGYWYVPVQQAGTYHPNAGSGELVNINGVDYYIINQNTNLFLNLSALNNALAPPFKDENGPYSGKVNFVDKVIHCQYSCEFPTEEIYKGFIPLVNQVYPGNGDLWNLAPASGSSNITYNFWVNQSNIFALVDENNLPISAFSSGITGSNHLAKLQEFSTNTWNDDSFWDDFENQWFKVQNPYDDEHVLGASLVLPLNREYYLKYILLPLHPEFQLLNGLFTADFTTYYNALLNNTVFVPSTVLGTLATGSSGYFSSYTLQDPLSLTSSTVTYSNLPAHPSMSISFPSGIYNIANVLGNFQTSGLSIYEFMDNDALVPTALKNKFHGSTIAPLYKGLFNTNVSKEGFFEKLYMDLRTTKHIASYFSSNSLIGLSDNVYFGTTYNDLLNLKPVVDAKYVWANIDVNLIQLSATSPNFVPYLDAVYTESTDPVSIIKKSLKLWFKDNIHVEPQSAIASELLNNYTSTPIEPYLDLQTILSSSIQGYYDESLDDYLNQINIAHVSGDLYDITLVGGTLISFDLTDVEVSLFSVDPLANDVIFNDFRDYITSLSPSLIDKAINNNNYLTDYITLQDACSTYLANNSGQISTYMPGCNSIRIQEIKDAFLSTNLFVYHYQSSNLDVFDNSSGCAYLYHEDGTYNEFSLVEMITDCQCNAIKTMAMEITGETDINQIVESDFTTIVNTQILENLGFSSADLAVAEPLFADYMIKSTNSGSCFNPNPSVNNLDLVNNDLIYNLLCTPYDMDLGPEPCPQLTPTEIAALNTDLYNSALDDLILEFTNWYETNKFDGVQEEITYHFPQKQYQQTLFYYDLEGNLIKTVAPKFVTPLDPSDLSQVTYYRGNPQGSASFTVPDHEGKATLYTYNSLNQMVSKKSPELHSEERYHYDLTGRLIASQSPEQKEQTLSGAGVCFMAYSAGAEMFSYTLYDNLGRIKESGVAHGNYSNLSSNYDLFEAYVLTLNRREVNITHYDDPVPTSVILPFEQQFLRNRVSWVEYHPVYTGTSSAAMINDDKYYRDAYSKQFYSYDVHGNVNNYFVEHRASAVSAVSKHMSYTYDLISGNVIKFAYQPGETDQFYHRYYYDESNRLIEAESSDDDVIWETDAKYFYYPHGPLARVELGDKQVQGMDYAYTLHGWLKSVNGVTNDRTSDMGADGLGGTIVNRNAEFAEDELSFKIDYYQGDYYDIGNTNNGISNFEGHTSLYNGNISAIKYDISELDVVNYKYRYDQLQRLALMESYNSGGVLSGYSSELSYDANGNILNLKRYQGQGGVGTLMDDINYGYYSDLNQLEQALDDIDDPDVDNDYVSNASNNLEKYHYDKIGNEIYKFAIREQYKGYRSNRWFYSGKVKSTANVFSDAIDNDNNPWRLNFFYDGSGHRVAKVLKTANDQGINVEYQVYDFTETEFEDKFENENTYTYTYYITDPTGNTIATYKHNFETESASEETLIETLEHFNIYGSSRLGTVNKEVETNRWQITLSSSGTSLFSNSTKLFDATQIDFVPLNIPTPSLDVATRELGNKNYELSNHLGNVLATISDRKDKHTVSTGIQGFYKSEVLTYSDYYPFGMQMPGRKYTSADGYRYGFQGEEQDDEIKGEGNSINYKFRMHDPRIGRFFAVDPLADKYPTWSPYTFSGNRVIDAIELEGLEPLGVKVAMNLYMFYQTRIKKWDERLIAANNNITSGYHRVSNSSPTSLEFQVGLKQSYVGVSQLSQVMTETVEVAGFIPGADVITDPILLGLDLYQGNYVSAGVTFGFTAIPFVPGSTRRIVSRYGDAVFDINYYGDEFVHTILSKEGLDDINIYTSAVADGKHLDVNIDLLPQGLVDEIGTYKNWDEAYDALKGKYRREMIEYKSMIIEEAKRQGYESIEISGKRATGSKKGTVQSTGVIDLTN